MLREHLMILWKAYQPLPLNLHPEEMIDKEIYAKEEVGTLLHRHHVLRIDRIKGNLVRAELRRRALKGLAGCGLASFLRCYFGFRGLLQRRSTSSCDAPVLSPNAPVHRAAKPSGATPGWADVKEMLLEDSEHGRLLFVIDGVVDGNNHTWRIWEDGFVEGFPPKSLVSNNFVFLRAERNFMMDELKSIRGS